MSRSHQYSPHPEGVVGGRPVSVAGLQVEEFVRL